MIILKILLILFPVLYLAAQLGKGNSVYNNDPEEKNPLEGHTVVFVPDEKDRENANGFRGHLESTGLSEYRAGFYEKTVKRILDTVLSYLALVLLSPLFLATALMIKLDDGGRIFFTQKRVGRNKQYFRIHKFRSMKEGSPEDLATARTDDPKPYLTRTGRFLRKSSLDELPQLWDIFLGNMSFVGPRPVIWQEESLIALRDASGANDVRPGLTGWAQVNGRDSIGIEEKALLDGEYVKRIGLRMDIVCFLRTFGEFGSGR